jgi:hypothetical protein
MACRWRRRSFFRGTDSVRALLGLGTRRGLAAFRSLLLPGHRLLHRTRAATFDPGTQGEHKIARGFEPTRTCSAHWLAHPGFADAVGRYLQRERAAIDNTSPRPPNTCTFFHRDGTTSLDPVAAPDRPTGRVSAGVRRARRAGRPALRRRRPLFARLLAAYRRGIFPGTRRDSPILWWSPDPRSVLFPGELRVSRSLAKTIRNRGAPVTTTGRSGP